MNPYTGPQSNAAMDFFQSLLKGSGMPSGFASWMAPTLDAEEIERKIVDLRAVLQWLEANVRLTQATIQALEVQRMTLSTLKTMNVDMGDLAAHMGEAMRAGAQAMGAASRAAAQGSPAGAANAAAEAGAQAASEPASEPAAEPASEAPRIPGLIDPMQWWSAVSEQFGKVAAEALRESPWAMAAGAGQDSQPEPQAAAASAPGSTRRRASRGADARPAEPAKAPARKRAPAATRRSR
jgi:hypothetical protein